MGKPTVSTDQFDQPEELGYDEFGRLETIIRDELEVAYHYDDYSRVSQIDIADETDGTETIKAIDWNEFPQQLIHTTTMSDGTEFIEKLTFYPNGNLHTRTIEEDSEETLTETFIYDDYKRLQQYQCEGTGLPKDEYGNQITQQVFTYYDLNNIQTVETNFASGERDICEMSYSRSDPCQLETVSHTHPSYGDDYPVTLSYDELGNLQQDEKGRHYAYDGEGKLIGVSDAARNPLSEYQYDANDRMIKQLPEGQPELQLFYSADKLINEMQDNYQANYQWLNGQLQGKTVKQNSSVLSTDKYITGHTNSIYRIINKQNGETSQTDYSYTAYGFQSNDSP